jgi:hypothetical protein
MTMQEDMKRYFDNRRVLAERYTAMLRREPLDQIHQQYPLTGLGRGLAYLGVAASKSQFDQLVANDRQLADCRARGRAARLRVSRMVQDADR